MEGNGRQRCMGALLAVVTAIFAAFLIMTGMTTPALAADQDAAVAITAERVSAGEYQLTITNNGSETIIKATGVTTVPQEILTDGAAASYTWQVSGLKSGASAVAQQDGKALIIHIKEGSTSGKTEEQITDNTAATVSTDTQRKTTDKKAVKESAEILGSTGSAVFAVALIAVGLAGVGISFKWENGPSCRAPYDRRAGNRRHDCGLHVCRSATAGIRCAAHRHSPRRHLGDHRER